MKTVFIYTLCLFSYWTTHANNALTTTAPQDSVGYEIVNGKLVILHKVEKGETLYALARRYQTSVAAIQQANGAAAQSLAVGTVLKIPTERKPTAPAKKVENNIPTNTNAQKHTVIQGQTLYAVARLYNVSVDDIRKWNNLTSDNLSTGQELIVGQKSANPVKHNETATTTPQVIEKDGKKIHTVANGESLFSIAKQYNTTAENLRRWNNLKQDALSVGQQVIVHQVEQNIIAPKPATNESTPTLQPNKENNPVNNTTPPTTINAATTGYEKIIENGIAEVVISEGGTEPRGHVCLHKTAPVGTILQVKNELNGLIVFVRVVGKLPDTIANEKLIIRISKKAHERLGAVDKRFPVEVSYPKP
jgi:LysM repeat protein